VSRSVQSIGRNYVQYYNECYGSTGTLWESRYRATVIDAKEYLLTCSRYIELNPVRNKLVDKVQDYRWSSYAHNALGKVDEMLTEAREYKRLGDNRKERARAYRALFRQKISTELAQRITEATLKGWALGDSKFVSKIEKLSGRRASQLPKGRPKGS
jgi:putative transposase